MTTKLLRLQVEMPNILTPRFEWWGAVVQSWPPRGLSENGEGEALVMDGEARFAEGLFLRPSSDFWFSRDCDRNGRTENTI